MAGNEATSQTTLWSSVVHQPCEEPEDAELPSTVDMAAFSTGLTVEPPTNTTSQNIDNNNNNNSNNNNNNTTNNNNNNSNNNRSESDSDSEVDSSNSGSEASQSCSQSDSSDTETTTSSIDTTTSRSPSPPEFSVTSTQTNGLRLTIATVRKSIGSPINNKSNQNDDNDNIDNRSNKSGDYSSCTDTQCSTESDSDDDDDDDDNTDHDDESNNKTIKSNNNKQCNKDGNLKRNLRSRSDKKINNRKETISPVKNPNLRSRNRPRKIRKMAASLPLSRGSTYSSSDTDESDADRAILASCSLQEIRQEDLAAILPDQQECDAFGDFDCSNSNNNRNSNNNSNNNNSNNNTNNSVNGGGIIDKNSPQVGDMSGSDMELPQQAVNALIQRTTESSSESESHPPPNPNTLYANSLLQQFVAQTQMLNAPCPIIPQTTNDGFNNNNNNNKTLIGGCEIQNNTNNNTSNTSTTTSATTNNKNNNNNDKSTNSNNSHTKDLDIDLVKRKRGRPRKGDNSIKPSNENKTNKSTINVDYCGDPNVSPDSGIQNSPDHHVSSPEPTILPTNKIKTTTTTSNRDNNDNKVNNNKTIKTESKCDKITINNNNNNKKEINKVSVTSNRFDRLLYANTDRVLYPPRRKSNRPLLKKGPGRPPKPKSINNGNNEAKLNEKNSENRGNDSGGGSSSNNKHNNHKTKTENKRPVLVAKNKIDNMNIKYTTLKNLKLMHSKHKHKKHKKCKFKILKPVTTVDTNSETKIEIDKLINDFSKYCVIGSINNNSNTNNNKLPKENIPELPVKTVKKVSKKRKTAEYSERKKKKIHINATVNKITNNLNNEQRLPLKKRHYLYSDGKNNVKQIKDEDITTIDDDEKDSSINNSTTTTTLGTDSNNGNGGGASTTTTPKKRHRLEVVNSKEGSPCLTTETQKNKPKLSLENLISELKMKRNNNNNNIVEVKCTTNEQELSQITATKKDIKDNQEQLKQSSIDTVGNKKKIRKRRAINRTGFPTIKKKKKKLIVAVQNEEIDEKPTIITTSNTTTTCDRVPKDGEEYNKFIQRTEIDKITKCEDSLSSITTNTTTTTTKWEILSECDSLPQDERELENENSNNTNCDLDEISLEASIERLRSRLDKKKRKRSNNNHNNNNEKIIDVYPKRKLRDISPASSIEPLMERRLRDERASASGDELKKNNRKIPRWRKKYLVAGLFSDYYKEDDETVRLKRNENITTKSRLIYKRDEHPYGLLPPPYHCGRYLRCRKIPFQLPYDLWWQHTHSQLPGRDIVPSWNYRKIRTNVYNVKITTGACEPQACNCTPSSNCGDDCINRLVLAECPATHKCQNQRIQKHEWAPGLEKFMTESKGWGVRTKYPIKNGEFILEYVGEVVSDQEFKERMATIYINDQHHYCLHLDGGLVIDGHRMGGDGRFVNHSCQPNCEMQKWSVNGQFRMALFALRDINSQEELTYDYNFSLFNPAEGQECKCGSDMCRGVIGGKSQRVRQLPSTIEQQQKNNGNNSGNNGNNNNNNNNNNGRVGRPRKNQAKRTMNNLKDLPIPQQSFPVVPTPQVKPISHQQKCFILEHHCFLLRNLSKVRKLRDRSNSTTTTTTTTVSRQQNITPTNQTSFINHLNALQKPRNIRTRRLAQAEDDPELNKTVKLASVLKDIWNIVTKSKDDNNELIGNLFMTLPAKRKVPEFYQRINEPIDLNTIEQNIATGLYLTPESFDSDMNRLFTNFIRFYGRTHELGIAAIKLKKIYIEAKQQNLTRIGDVLGTKPPPNFVSNKNKNEEEDIIRCICGLPRDEGLMIQCERCMVWQHSECVKADVNADSYHCEQCVPRDVDYEIPLDEFTEHGHRYYLTLLRGDLQLRQGDTVYVLRDIPIPGTDRKHTYDTIGKIDYTELDIFRIERLWKDSTNGQRFAYGHHYLRPHETYHEPTRKFFSNEVMRVPLYEAVPVELIIQHCWVMDINTYCKGRPIGAPEQHIYICEYRVDKSARLFSKVSKSKFPICTKSFAFEKFEQRLKISRTYTPHDLDPSLIKPRGRKPQENDNDSKDTVNNNHNNNLQQVNVPVIRIRTPVEQKARLNKILLNLLSKMPTKQVLDVSYLLEGGRRRKKQQIG